MSLQAIAVPPRTGKEPSGLFVALHGWGANAQDLVSIVPLLNLPDYQFILPDAPFPHPQVAEGKAWYDFQRNNQGYPESQKQLRDWLQSLESSTGVPLERTILGGFSQGAAMTLDVGLSLPLAGLIALSGYLHPVSNPSLKAFPPVLLVHGRQDSIVPLRAAEKARDTLLALDVSVQYHEFNMGHEITPEVLVLIRKFVLEVISQEKQKVY